MRRSTFAKQAFESYVKSEGTPQRLKEPHRGGEPRSKLSRVGVVESTDHAFDLLDQNISLVVLSDSSSCPKTCNIKPTTASI
jgi:hypothetical protein